MLLELLIALIAAGVLGYYVYYQWARRRAGKLLTRVGRHYNLYSRPMRLFDGLLGITMLVASGIAFADGFRDSSSRGQRLLMASSCLFLSATFFGRISSGVELRERGIWYGSFPNTGFLSWNDIQHFDWRLGARGADLVVTVVPEKIPGWLYRQPRLVVFAVRPERREAADGVLRKEVPLA
ncbi:MAG: hypothetical protein U1D30_12540 [Planctomycetota bacterium]